MQTYRDLWENIDQYHKMGQIDKRNEFIIDYGSRMRPDAAEWKSGSADIESHLRSGEV